MAEPLNSMAIFNFQGIRIAAMATAMPSTEVRPDDFKDHVGEEEVEKCRERANDVGVPLRIRAFISNNRDYD